MSYEVERSKVVELHELNKTLKEINNTLQEILGALNTIAKTVMRE